jgi:hypothetical protein
MEMETTNDSIGKYDAVFGQNIDLNNPLLNPKLKHAISYLPFSKRYPD